MEERLSSSGWGGRAACVAIDPELEVWVWTNSPHVESLLGWKGRQPGLRDWLREQGHLQGGEGKPSDPKGAVQMALRVARRPRESRLYAELAQTVSLDGCVDEAFLKLRRTLSGWFGASHRQDE